MTSVCTIYGFHWNHFARAQWQANTSRNMSTEVGARISSAPGQESTPRGLASGAAQVWWVHYSAVVFFMSVAGVGSSTSALKPGETEDGRAVARERTFARFHAVLVSPTLCILQCGLFVLLRFFTIWVVGSVANFWDLASDCRTRSCRNARCILKARMFDKDTGFLCANMCKQHTSPEQTFEEVCKEQPPSQQEQLRSTARGLFRFVEARKTCQMQM